MKMKSRVCFCEATLNWSLGSQKHQPIIDGIRRKSELIFNVSKELLPGATVIYYD